MLNENIISMLAREIINANSSNNRALLALRVYCGTQESCVDSVKTEFAKERAQQHSQFSPSDLIGMLNEWEDLKSSIIK
jgi:hypothetical protein